jgi:integrase
VTARTAGRLAWSLWGLAMALEVAGILLWLPNHAELVDRFGTSEDIYPHVFLVPGYATVGAVTAARRRLAVPGLRAATPPPVPRREVAALAPEQVALLLDAAERAPSPWLGPWTVLAAATGARNGELCGLEWADLDLDAGTVRFHQALTIIDPAVLPDDADSGGRRKELVVGPVKSAASNAILTLPPFAVQALRQHRREQARWRLAGGQPQTVPLRRVEPGRPAQLVQLDLVFRTERGTAVNPNHASRAFARLAASVGLVAHPHMLRHALASAMAAEKEPASIIAAQLRHADGGALAQRVYIHQLPQTAPRVAGVIEGVFGPAARDGRAVSAGRRAEGNRRETRPSNPA